MRKPARDAFTLVELLVVITIIGMLMAMIFPALGAFLARVDLLRCQNNQQEVAKAIQQYVNSKQRYPGYVTRVMTSGERGGSRQPVLKSWVVAAMEMMDKEKFDAIRNNLSTQPVELKTFNCAANARQGDLIGYVANCGRKDAPGTSGNIPPDWKSNGVFMRESLQKSSGMRDEIVRSTDIPDGEGTTILISENMQAARWTQFGEQDIGMVWHTDGPNPDVPNKDTVKINVGKDTPIDTGNYDYARPSSNHTEGVVVAFCDARTIFLSDRVDYGGVYCKLMTPNGPECKEPGQNKPSADFFRQPFDERKLNP